MEQVKELLRYHHYAYRTEQCYCDWIMRYLRFHGGNRHPRELTAWTLKDLVERVLEPGDSAIDILKFIQAE